MKKLLMIGAILALGTTMAYGAAVTEKATADVTVKAQIVSDNLIITDLNGNPIILDFKKVNQLQETGTTTAFVDYKVSYIGGSELTGKTSNLTMKLGGEDNPIEIVMKEEANKVTPDKFTAMVGLSEYKGIMENDDNDDLGTTGKTYVGRINGTIDHENTKLYKAGAEKIGNTGFSSDLRINDGNYLATTVLAVSLNDGQ